MLSGFVASEELEHIFILKVRYYISNAKPRGNAGAGGSTLTKCAQVARIPKRGESAVRQYFD
jgi:hypothetical protein